MGKQLSLGAKLWTAVAIAMGLLLFTLVFATARTTAVQTRSDQANRDQIIKVKLAEQWTGLTETNVTRVLASVISSDAVVDELFKAQIQTGIAQIDEVQKKLEALPHTDQDRATLSRIAEDRKAVLASLAKAREFKSAGKQAEAVQEVKERFAPAVATYVGHLKEFAAAQSSGMDTLNAGFAAEREVNQWLTRGLVGGLLALLAVGTYFVVQQIRQPLKDAIAVAEVVASGDLTGHIPTHRQDEFGELMRALEHMQQQLVHLVTDVRHSTDSISTGSAEIASGNQDLSSRTEQTASSLEETASSMEHLTSTVRQSADSARQANQLAASAAQVAQRGGAVVGQVVTTMEEINQSSRKIADIISVIDGIAFQTNILALNAAVEAARAGEQGRGFAVVAAEVRSLAGRSAEAAKEIKSLISTSVEKVDGGTRLVADAGATMHEIVTSVQRVRDIIGEISVASNEQADGISQVNSAVSHLDQMTQQNAALVEQSAAAATSMMDQARRLAEVVATFKLSGRLAPSVATPARVAAPARTPAPRPVGARAQPMKPAAKSMASVTPPKIAHSAAPGKAAPQVASGKPPGGTDDDWETF